MQTFLPFKSFYESARVLDNRRLGKQRVECLQILKALHDPEYGWQNHPATKMWRADVFGLAQYGLNICDEWIRRGFKDTCRDKIAQFSCTKRALQYIIPPDWVTDDFCLSHRSNLVRKMPEHYSKYFPDVSGDLPYVWPV
jgi:hypothetical protein